MNKKKQELSRRYRYNIGNFILVGGSLLTAGVIGGLIEFFQALHGGQIPDGGTVQDWIYFALLALLVGASPFAVVFGFLNRWIHRPVKPWGLKGRDEMTFFLNFKAKNDSELQGWNLLINNSYQLIGFRSLSMLILTALLNRKKWFKAVPYLQRETKVGKANRGPGGKKSIN